MAYNNKVLGTIRGTMVTPADSITVKAVPSQEVTTFSVTEVNAAYQKWAAMESQRVTARKAYDDAVISGLQLTYSAQMAFNAINAQATEARTNYYAIVAALKKQLRNREVFSA